MNDKTDNNDLMRARRKMQSTLCGSYHGVSKCTFCIRLKQSRQKNCQPVCVQAFCWWWWKPSISCSVTLQIKINTSCHQYRDHFIRKGKKKGGKLFSQLSCHMTKTTVWFWTDTTRWQGKSVFNQACGPARGSVNMSPKMSWVLCDLGSGWK